ncbi:hypothetical protein [Sphingosinicella sp. BN140058]|uniref:hypothetical protein n=1 Tax=Sphingosinicella sp. BN140058 TaxID=1892855 RepID=UPI001012DD0F|nr:hypothetical protein [Sphingosinicella sp. BN140058]QAY80253.1 hypothetical protein ETR14_26785 [Sphingosinicella sp. BN140058]
MASAAAALDQVGTENPIDTLSKRGWMLRRRLSRVLPYADHRYRSIITDTLRVLPDVIMGLDRAIPRPTMIRTVQDLVERIASLEPVIDPEADKVGIVVGSSLDDLHDLLAASPKPPSVDEGLRAEAAMLVESVDARFKALGKRSRADAHESEIERILIDDLPRLNMLLSSMGRPALQPRSMAKPDLKHFRLVLDMHAVVDNL